MTNHRNRILALVFACMFSFAGAFACGGGGDPSEPVSLDTLQTYHVKQLQFTGAANERSNMESEIHIVNTANNNSVLCAGVDNGMQVVQSSGTDYDDLDVNFIRTNGSSLEELTSFYVIALERDTMQCPGAPNFETDTTLAKSGNIDFEDLTAGQVEMNATNNGSVTFGFRGEDPGAFEISQLLDLRLKSIYIPSIDAGEFSSPEIEVHVVDVVKNEVITCVALDSVNDTSTLYDYLYMQSSLASDVQETDTASWLRIVLIERDDASCPEPFTVGMDRIIGSSHVMTLDGLAAAGTFSLAHSSTLIEIVSEISILESVGSVAADEFDGIIVDSIQYYGDKNEFSSAEIEIHIEDVWTDETIACAGANEGLTDVNDQETLYENLNATLTSVWASDEDPFGEVRVVILERDVSACPNSATRANNDYLAEKVVDFDDLTSAPIEFDNGSIVTFTTN